MIKRLAIIFSITCACTLVQAQDFDIITIAGCDSLGAYGGDGGPAINCKFYYPIGLSLDTGNLYIADLANSRIRKITLSTGIITTVAGRDTFGYGGDGGQATNAILWYPEDVTTDSAGNIFFSDGLENRLRKVTVSTGIITTVAGIGIAGSSGDGGSATNAEMNGPTGLRVDKSGNIYFSDFWNNKVRKVDATTGIITTIAGTGVAGNTGNGGPATDAKLNEPENIFLDSVGNIFIAENGNNIICKVDISTGIITAIAGTGTMGYSGNGGLAVNAELNQPAGGYFDKQGNTIFADYGNGVIRKIDGVTGIITTIAGNGTWGFSGDGGPATDAQIIPADIVADSLGIMYIADYGNNRIRMVYNTLGVAPPRPSPKEREVWPNPAMDVLHIDNGAGNVLYMYDMLGQVICQKVLSSDKETVNISTFPAGVYVARIVDATGGEINRKVVKE